ncbi:alpha-L-fucosidase [Streptomyces sp. NPDC058534]|uniref:alpha-L-fucosidase n=1 Tax=Streptomyces sp. NPDC058534 TaxID=3346541 RepID=UPI0036671372
MLAVTPVSAAGVDAADIGFGGSFSSGNNYTAATGETMQGTLRRLAGTERLDVEKGLVLTGGTTGAVFSSRSENLVGGTTLSKSFVTETVFTPDAGQGSLATVLSVGGNLWARYQDGRLRYGYSSRTGGGWQEHSQSVPAPEGGTSHALSLAYEVQGGSSSLRAFLDGAELPKVTADGSLAAGIAGADVLGIGNEVHAGARGRGIAGSVSKARLSVLTGEFNPRDDVKYQRAKASGTALLMSFQAPVTDGAYTPELGETVVGRVSTDGLTQRRPGSARAPGAGSSLTWSSQQLPTPHLAGRLRAEVVVDPGVLRHPGTLIDLGGAVTLDVGGKRQVTLRAGDAVEKTLTLPAPQSKDGVDYWHLGLATDLDDKGSGTVQVLAAGNPLGPGVAVTSVTTTRSDVRYFDGLRGTLYGASLELDGADSEASLTAVPCMARRLAPAHAIAVTSGECLSSLRAKASAIRPTQRQVDWQRAQQTAFLHFGVNTFTGQEWGYGNEDPDVFNPTKLDTDQWARTLKDNGFTIAVLTVKHHDGFVLYPSRYTDHDVASSAWLGGRGDVLRMFADSMRKHGIGVGVYLSPADENQERKGVFGNGSPKVERTIPTLLKDDDRAGKNPPAFSYKATEYGSYFLNQLYEVLTEYGPISEVWFDGAQGRTSKPESYDFRAYYDLVRKLAPQAVIAVSGPDVRWVGNESGLARPDEWSVVPVRDSERGEPGTYPNSREPDLGSDAALVRAAAEAKETRLTWYPAEVDVSIHAGWFWHDEQQPKSVDQLNKIYYESAGRNSVLLLNIPPNKEGLIDQRDVSRLSQWRTKLWHDMPRDLALDAPAFGDGEEMTLLTDGYDDTSWRMRSPRQHASVVLDEPQRVDRIALGEDIGRGGMQAQSVTVEAKVGDAWQPVLRGGTVGYQRIFPLDQPVTAKEFRVSFPKSRGVVHLARISLYGSVPTEQPVDMTGELGGQRRR